MGINFFTKRLKRAITKADWHNLRTLTPISSVFGFDRGTPIDRFYIEHFLGQRAELIKGMVCEVGDVFYARKYGGKDSTNEVFKYSNGAWGLSGGVLAGDLTKINSLPPGRYDCFIGTQVLNFVYDVKAAVKGIHYLLKPGGVAFLSVAGITQISAYDRERWGDYFRFTDQSLKKLLEDEFGRENVNVVAFGNILAAVAILHGIASEELERNELLFSDDVYQVTICAVAKKRS